MISNYFILLYFSNDVIAVLTFKKYPLLGQFDLPVRSNVKFHVRWIGWIFNLYLHSNEKYCSSDFEKKNWSGRVGKFYRKKTHFYWRKKSVTLPSERKIYKYIFFLQIDESNLFHIDGNNGYLKSISFLFRI
jgi:hypothetical protein